MNSKVRYCYQVLELEPGTSLEQVKQSWRELVKVWHPDRFPNDVKMQHKAQERLKSINEAYEFLEKYLQSGAFNKSEATHSQPSTASNNKADSRSQSNSTPQPSNHTKDKNVKNKPRPLIVFTITVFGIVAIGLLLAFATRSHTSSKSPENFRIVAVGDGDTPNTNAIQQGPEDALAQYELGLEAWRSQNYVEAARWFRKAAEQGLSKAQYALGLSYQRGIGVNTDEIEAAKWYLLAAQQGDVKAQYELGKCYEYGLGVRKNMAEANKWDRMAAEQGHVEAQRDLGLFYDKAKNFTEAAKWYRLAAEQGDVKAQYFLSYIYFAEWDNYSEALKWAHKAADGGCTNVSSLIVAAEKSLNRTTILNKWKTITLGMNTQYVESILGKPDELKNFGQVLSSWRYHYDGCFDYSGSVSFRDGFVDGWSVPR